VTPTHAGAAGAAHAPPAASRLGRAHTHTPGPCAGSPTPGNTPTCAAAAAAAGGAQQDLGACRAQLAQLMASAHAFVASEAVATLLEGLAPVAAVYDAMHDLPVVRKRRSCEEMAGLRAGLLADAKFVGVMQAASALRDHIYSLSRKVGVRARALLLLAWASGRGGGLPPPVCAGWREAGPSPWPAPEPRAAPQPRPADGPWPARSAPRRCCC
jgi:hypothetical protein